MQYSFFDAVNYDRLYNSADWAKYFMTFIGNGVFADPADGMQVHAKSGMVLGIKSGKCFINGRCGYADGSDTVTLDYGSSGAYRYDAVCARLDLNARDIHIEVIRGDDADSFAKAVKPKPLREGQIYDLILAYVAIGEAMAVVTNADITDVRYDDDLCGVVTGVVDQISTAKLFAQYEAQWELLKAGCAQDADAVIAAWSALNTTKAVNGITPEGGNVKLTQSNIPSDDIAYQMKYFIQSGTVTVDSSAGTESGGVNIVFPKKYKTAPLILLSATDINYNSASRNTPSVISYNDVTAEGFTLKAYQLWANSCFGYIDDKFSAAVSWAALGQLLYATITKQPKDQTVGVGENATFSVSAIGNGITYRWQRSDNGGQTWDNSSITSSGIVITAGADVNGRLYRCIVTDEFGWSVTSDAAKLIVTGG